MPRLCEYSKGEILYTFEEDGNVTIKIGRSMSSLRFSENTLVIDRDTLSLDGLVYTLKK